MPVVGLFIESRFGYGSRIMEGIAAFARSQPDWAIELFDVSVDELGKLMRVWRGDGVIGTVHGATFKRAARAAKYPVICVTGVLDDAENVVPTVRSDDRAMGESAAAYLIDRGFQQVIAVYRENRAAEGRRIDAFLSMCRRRGIKPITLPLPSDTPLGSYIERLNDAVVSWPPASAVFTSEDRLGMSVIYACRAAGRHVPNDLAVLGSGNDALACELSNPTLSSVDGDLHRRGFEAAAWLDAKMNGRPLRATDKLVIIPPIGVITRQSTNAFAMADQQVVGALVYIREHLADRIDIETVAGAVRLSRRSLEIRLRRARGRSVQAEIWHQRVTEAKRLLRRKENSVTDVAYACGFTSPSAFSIIFRRDAGMTPTAYREWALGL